MSGIRYFIVDRDGESDRSCGILCVWREDGSARSLHIPDVTADRARLARFVRLLNRLKASPIHLCDLVEDFLGQ